MKSGQRGVFRSDFRFREPWPDPLKMIERMHAEGVKLVLWQIPA